MRPRWIALTAIWFYWSSLFWLRPLLSFLEIRLADYPALQGALNLYFAPLRCLTPWVPTVFGRVGRAHTRWLAASLGATICLVVWGLLVIRAQTRRTMRGG